MTKDEQSRKESQNESFKATWNSKIENPVKLENKLEEYIKKAYAMIFKELCPSIMQDRLEEHPKYDSIIDNPLKLMDAISKSMQ